MLVRHWYFLTHWYLCPFSTYFKFHLHLNYLKISRSSTVLSELTPFSVNVCSLCHEQVLYVLHFASPPGWRPVLFQFGIQLFLKGSFQISHPLTVVVFLHLCFSDQHVLALTYIFQGISWFSFICVHLFSLSNIAHVMVRVLSHC